MPEFDLQQPARWPWQVLSGAAEYAAPNLFSLLSGGRSPEIPNLPEYGKVPSVDDPRPINALGEAANLGINFFPLPGASFAAAPRAIARAMGLVGQKASEAEIMASRMVNMYNPPGRPLRPFEADYPSGAPADASGRLTADIEGRPLTAKYVVGRRVVGGEDEVFPATEFDALTAETIGRPSEVLPSRAAGRNAGRTLVDRV